MTVKEAKEHLYQILCMHRLSTEEQEALTFAYLLIDRSMRVFKVTNNTPTADNHVMIVYAPDWETASKIAAETYSSNQKMQTCEEIRGVQILHQQSHMYT